MAFWPDALCGREEHGSTARRYIEDLRARCQMDRFHEPTAEERKLP